MRSKEEDVACSRELVSSLVLPAQLMPRRRLFLFTTDTPRSSRLICPCLAGLFLFTIDYTA